MSSPRRRTLESVPQQIPFLVIDSDATTIPQTNTSKAARRHVRVHSSSPMSIDVRLADAYEPEGKHPRPLPRVPTTPCSAPAETHSYGHRRQHSNSRPLPTLPETGVAISVTPATPLPPPTPLVERAKGTTLLAPKPHLAFPPTRYSSLGIDIASPDAADRDANADVPEPPSPRTAQRMRHSKLRRFLGESVQIVLDEPGAADVLGRLREPRSPFPEGTVLDLRQESESDESSDDGAEYSDAEDDDDSEIYERPSTPQKLESEPEQKWVRERGKHRWTEDNFAQILQDLRNL
ncbi:hypothetical protein HMN09_01221400 [Mycena chlorophos]|uniref:Uncharacterized protein n=1 Tax=Mycena chlorophos TaxID=658473 RepID=A0A8H6S4V3_MYCCL|nr:hypothetical protein HMN09_01221400 [Mycena chlorophos]